MLCLEAGEAFDTSSCWARVGVLTMKAEYLRRMEMTWVSAPCQLEMART